MKQEWTNRDRSEWGSGPWDTEPDHIQWVDPATDLDCLMNRGPGGHWCGYVGIPETHPLFGKDYDDAGDIDVHGGLTFASLCDDDAAEGAGVCHIPESGRSAHIWWFGFDCFHGWDMSPSRRMQWPEAEGRTTYKSRAYVEREIASLAKQLAAAKP